MNLYRTPIWLMIIQHVSTRVGGFQSRQHLCLRRHSANILQSPIFKRCRTPTVSAYSTLSNESSRVAKERQLNNASTLSLAPMMEYTDRHMRHLVRLISTRTLLYTEMVAANAIVRERQDCMDLYRQENPDCSQTDVKEKYADHYLQRYLAQGCVQPEGSSVLQLGGSDPRQLFDAAETVQEMTARGHCDYTGINLNCGCPSPKVAGKGCFGAALMDEPKLVADLVKAIDAGAAGALPVSVKCRIGTDSQYAFGSAGADAEDEYAHLCRFVETVAASGIVTDFSVHARIAVLQKSFSPADNRKIPPLRYDVVQRLVRDYPELNFTLNGGVDTISQVQEQLQASPGLAGVMVGRAWAADPWSFAMTDELLYGDPRPQKNRLQILEEYGRHADAEEAKGDATKIRRFIVKAVVPLFAGELNGKRYRIALDEIAGIPKQRKKKGKTMDGQPPLSELILDAAAKHISQDILLRTPSESYEAMIQEEQRRKLKTINARSDSIKEWQIQRKEAERVGALSMEQ